MEVSSKPTSLYSVKDGQVQLNLHAGQAKAWQSEARYIFMIAGTQGGKTSFGPWWLHREITMCGGGDYIAATSSYDLFKLKMLPEIRKVFEDILQIGRFWPGEKIIELMDPETERFLAKRSSDEMWGRIILRSAAAEAGLESATAKAAWLDEVGQDSFKVTAWNAVERRVSLNRGRVLGTTTPYNFDWLKQLIFDRWRGGDKNIDVIQFDSLTNPLFSSEEFDDARDRMPKWKFDMFYRGIFTRPAGQIFGDFVDDYEKDGGHKVKPFPIPAAWPVVIGIDPGAVNTAKLWIATDPETDKSYVFRCSLKGGLSTKDHTKEVIDLQIENRERLMRWFIGAKAEVQQRLDYSSHGAVPVFAPPVSDVEAGIDRVIQLFKEKKLFIFDTESGLIGELNDYSRVVDAMGNLMPEIRNKSKYHRIDSLRYAAAGLSVPVGVFFV